MRCQIANELPPLRKWVSHRLTPDVQRSLTRLRRAADVRYLAIMPDVHLAIDVCIGTVLATQSLVYPAAVGGDIGCGILAIGFNAEADVLRSQRAGTKLLQQLYATVPCNRHASGPKPLSAQLSKWKLSDQRLEKLKTREGRFQLGTLGRGNHFLELQADAADRLWLMIHSGSRSMGQAITRHHLQLANRNEDGVRSNKLMALETTEQPGRNYWNDMQWARAYAKSNRESMMESAIRVLKSNWSIEVDPDSLIHTDHNHAEEESHFGQKLLVHRKGAQGLAAGELGIVPGSMATSSFLVKGRACETSLRSCSHGAGRQLSRTEARNQVSVARFEHQMGGVVFDRNISARLRDEAPAAYKDVRQVMRSQRELISIISEHEPILSFKGRA